MTRLPCLAFLLVAAPALADTPAAPDPARDDIRPVTYTCAGGETLDAVFLNTAAGNSYAVLWTPQGLLPMQVAISASGARYAAIAPGDDRVFWTKGDTATLYAGPDGGQVLLADCRATG